MMESYVMDTTEIQQMSCVCVCDYQPKRLDFAFKHQRKKLLKTFCVVVGQVNGVFLFKHHALEAMDSFFIFQLDTYDKVNGHHLQDNSSKTDRESLHPI